MKKIILALLLFAAGVLSAQNVSIDISGADIGGKQIRLFLADDYLSGLDKEVAEKTLSQEDTSCRFGLLTDGVSVITIKIDAFEYSFISQPGKVYSLWIDSINFTLADSVNVLMYKQPLPIAITNLAPDDLNPKIGRFDAAVEDFVSRNARSLLVTREKAVTDSLVALIDSFLENEPQGSYFAEYVKYESGKIKHVLRLESRKALREELFGDKPVQYYNMGYMDCFNHIFSHYFSQGNKYISQDELEFWLTTNNYDDLMDALGKDKVLKNEVFREFVLIKGMKDAYLEGGFDRADIIKMLEKIASRTKFEQHRKTALATVEYLSGISHSGLAIKDFETIDINGEKQNISQFLNKPLVINFVKLNDISSKRELEVVNYMYESIKDNCNVLSVCCDRSLDAMYNFLRNTKVGNKYKWNFAFFNSNYDLLEFFQVRTFPAFILVSPEGKIEENPMRNPSEGGLSRFANQKQEKQ
ncbi:MAG: TlpA family protein disulfide reductase [Candidatus Onthomorpha sp.]